VWPWIEGTYVDISSLLFPAVKDTVTCFSGCAAAHCFSSWTIELTPVPWGQGLHSVDEKFPSLQTGLKVRNGKMYLPGKQKAPFSSKAEAYHVHAHHKNTSRFTAVVKCDYLPKLCLILPNTIRCKSSHAWKGN